MAKSRTLPGVVVVAAVLLIVFSVLMILGSFFSFATSFLPDQAGMNKGLEEEAPGYIVVQYIEVGLALVLGIIGVVAGIGLLKLNPKARTLAQVLCVVIILTNWVESAYLIIFVVGPMGRSVQKQMDQQMKGQGNANMPNFLGDLMSFCVGGGVVFSIVFTLALYLSIFFLLRSKTSRDAFAGKLVAEPPDDDIEDDRRRSRYSGYDDDDDVPPSSPHTGITDRPPL